MAKRFQEIDLKELSEALRKGRERKGWTLEELSHELWERGFPTSQNKLWRMENKPPRRLDTELLLWLEKVLDVSLIAAEHQKQVLIDDVIELVDSFIEVRAGGGGGDPDGGLPREPGNASLLMIHTKLTELVAGGDDDG